MHDKQSKPAPRKYLGSRGVCNRYHFTPRTLRRWEENSQLAFPKAMLVNGRKYFDEAALDAWDRARAIASVRDGSATSAANVSAAQADAVQLMGGVS